MITSPSGKVDKKKYSYVITAIGELWEYDVDEETGAIDYSSGVKIEDADGKMQAWDTLLRPYLEPALLTEIQTRLGCI